MQQLLIFSGKVLTSVINALSRNIDGGLYTIYCQWTQFMSEMETRESNINTVMFEGEGRGRRGTMIECNKLCVECRV